MDMFTVSCHPPGARHALTERDGSSRTRPTLRISGPLILLRMLCVALFPCVP